MAVKALLSSMMPTGKKAAQTTCVGAALYGSRSRHAGEKRQGRHAEILQVRSCGHSLLPHRHVPVHAGRVGYGRDQARILRFEKQPHLRDDLRDAAPLQHP